MSNVLSIFSGLALVSGLFFTCKNGAPSKGPNPDAKAVHHIAPVPKTPKDTIVFPKNELMGNFEPESHPDFVRIEQPYSQKPNMLLRTEAAEAFKKMYAAAQKEGIELTIISSTRNFGYQKIIWEGKWKKYAQSHPHAPDRANYILKYSAMPSTSRHHWGTDIDLNDLNNSSFEKGGKFEKVYQWLSKNAVGFGFCQPYTEKGVNRPNGYNEERWHWSYMPLARQMLKDYEKQIKTADIKDFSGAQTAETVGAIEFFVKGIACQ